MGRVLDTWRSWSVRRRLAVTGGFLLLVAGGALAAYLALKRPGDVVNTEAIFRAPPKEPKKKEKVETVDWPVYGYDDERTRYLPSELVRPPYHASDWSFQAGKLLEFSPIVVNKSLYFMDKDALFYSLDSATGKIEWKRDIGTLNASSPAYAGDRLFAVTLSPGQAVALRPKDGKVLWSHPIPGRSETSPVVVGDKLIVGCECGDVYALDVDTGKTLWTVPSAGAVKGGVAVHNGVAYYGNYAGEVFAVRISNGSIVWQSGTQGASFGRTGRIYSTPTVAYGRVYLGSIDGRVYSFEAASGDLAWSHSTGAEVYPGPAVADTPDSPPTVYIGSADKHFYALDARDGSLRWEHYIGGIILGAPSVIGNIVYVGVIGPANGTLGFDTGGGQQVFEHELGEYNPVISDGKRLYLTGSSALRAFTPLTPNERRQERKEKRAKHRRQRHAHERKLEQRREKRRRQRQAHERKLEQRREKRADRHGGGKQGGGKQGKKARGGK